MESNKVDQYLMLNSKHFPEESLSLIRDLLLKADDSKYSLMTLLSLKDATTAILMGIFAGTLGIDRFYIGDTGLGIGKLLTCGGLGIWAIIDLFLIMDATKQKNANLIISYLQ